jgi:hypothetical protein
VLAFGGWMEKTVGMRGSPDPQLSMLTSLSTEDLIPADHPIRRIRVVVDAVLVKATVLIGEVLDPLGASVLRTPNYDLLLTTRNQLR